MLSRPANLTNPTAQPSSLWSQERASSRPILTEKTSLLALTLSPLLPFDSPAAPPLELEAVVLPEDAVEEEGAGAKPERMSAASMP
jgi:hypothetical protein